MQVETTTLSAELATHGQGLRRPLGRQREMQGTSHILTLQQASQLCHVEWLQLQRETRRLGATWERAISRQQRLRRLQAQVLVRRTVAALPSIVPCTVCNTTSAGVARTLS